VCDTLCGCGCRHYARRGGKDKEDALAAEAIKAAAAAADVGSDTAAAAAAGGGFKDVHNGTGRHSNGSRDDGVCATDGGTPSAFVRAAAAPIDATSAKQGPAAAAAAAPAATVQSWNGKPVKMVSWGLGLRMWGGA
jgi:hypothetical protein